jgi:putative zinc finger protein
MRTGGSSIDGSSAADHPSLDDLADAAEGLLDPDRAARVAAHLAGCARCRDAAAALSGVTTALAAAPDPGPMPDAVVRRLDDVLAIESAQRAAAQAAAQHGGAHPLAVHRPSLGHFELHRPPARSWRRWAPALAAAALACVVGLGGYVASATAGLNEPPQVTADLSSADLGRQAAALAETRDLDPHRFSQAWLCARSVTAGRVTGLARARVDGAPVLLVYLRSEGATSVTVVTGCGGAAPDVVATAALPG